MTYFKIFLFTVMMLAYQVEARKRCNSLAGDYSRDALISVIPNNAADREYLWDLDRKKVVDLWNEIQVIIGHKNLMRVSRSKLKSLMQVFRKRNMKVYVVAPNLQRFLQRNSNTFLMNERFDPQNVDFSQYHTFENIELFLKDITERHKDISKLDTFGKSYEERPMYSVKVSSNKGNVHARHKRKEKQIILIDCGIHAREWTSISFCVFFINALITDYKGKKKEFKRVLNKYDFIIIPVMNPDGFVFTLTKDRLWRKTRSKIPGTKCIGADANRNFYSPGTCTDNDPCSESFCGHKPFSEPEIAAFKVLLENTNGKLKAYFNIHTYGQYWLSPWAKSKDKKPKHYDEMMRVAEIGKKALKKRYNTKCTSGMASELMYQVEGAAMDYVYGKGFVNYSFALELRDKGDCTSGLCGFMLPPEKVLHTCEETTDGIMAAILAMK